ncbi:MAG: accessory gene regulator B family protein [Clostridia bacterium]|nr:accessory gene regulator B family protein [Clostridia bacterium]
MVEKISNYFLDNVLIKDEEVSEEKREILLFGVKRIVEDIPKFTAIIIIAYFLNILPQLGVVFLINLVYKTFVGGAHARTNIECFIYSTLYLIGSILLAKVTYISNIVLVILYILNYILSVYVIYKIAPADTEEIPIINKEQRKKLKIFAFISINLIYLVFILFVKNMEYKEMIIYVLLFINIMTTKPVYRFLRCKYSYESDEFKDLIGN